MLEFDHLVIGAESLDKGVDDVRQQIGVTMPFGGKHPLMATHNHLMALRGDAFFEVIAVDPDAQTDRPRWFGLDDFNGSTRAITWVLRSRNIDETLAQIKYDIGRPVRLTRGELSWRLTVRDDGSLPMGGVVPQIIEWDEGRAPVSAMENFGFALEKLILRTPIPEILGDILQYLTDNPCINVVYDEKTSIEYELSK